MHWDYIYTTLFTRKFALQAVCGLHDTALVSVVLALLAALLLLLAILRALDGRKIQAFGGGMPEFAAQFAAIHC